MRNTSRATVRRLVHLAVAAIPIAGVIGLVEVSPAGADTVTFSSGTIGQTGSTPTFAQSGPWTLTWQYSNCSGGTGNFSVDVNGSSAADPGPNELGSGGSGTDYYYDSGTSFNLSIISECDWNISIAPSGSGPLTNPTYSSSQIGHTGQTQQFTVSSQWTMSWSYSNCSGGTGNFSVDIVQPPSDLTFDAGPNELGSGGSGTDTYTDTGVFRLQIISECDWSITINSAGSPAPAPAPTPAPTPNPVIVAAVGMASTPDGGGYWIAWTNGAVHPHGDAGDYGGVQNLTLNAPITHIVSTPDGRGYWLVAADGGTFTEGNAQFYGSTGGMHLNAPVVDIAPTPDGAGYWLVASDGGIFSYGDAQFYGSTGSLHLNQPVVGMATTPDGRGYGS